jgi:four helix bundle protein
LGDCKNTNIKTFEDLIVWRKAINLSVRIYKETKSFPKSEQFGITNQLRRASSSISANIAEGFGRATPKDKLQFYSIAHGSLLETKNFIYLCHKIGYIDEIIKEDLIKDTVDLQMLLNGFIRSTKKRAS